MEKIVLLFIFLWLGWMHFSVYYKIAGALVKPNWFDQRTYIKMYVTHINAIREEKKTLFPIDQLSQQTVQMSANSCSISIHMNRTMRTGTCCFFPLSLFRRILLFLSLSVYLHFFLSLYHLLPSPLFLPLSISFLFLFHPQFFLSSAICFSRHDIVCYNSPVCSQWAFLGSN